VRRGSPAALVVAHRKAGRDRASPGFLKVPFVERLRSVPLELEEFVLDAELLALQIGDRIPIWQGTPILFIDGAL
jgi:hypothetical protein